MGGRHRDSSTAAISTVLGARGELDDHLRGRELLLLLDNFEHVLAAAPELAALPRVAPRLRLLVTSRERLRLSGEREYALRPLAESPAVELFRQRAEAVRSDFTGEYGELDALCRRLDRLPLALELAAARVKVLEPAALLERLERRLPLLTGGGRDAPERQRTLRGTIEWSRDLLSSAERALFGRVSVFAGGFDLRAAEAVAGADLDVLQSLVDKSLVREAGGRFAMLETIRELAAEELDDETRRRHAAYFLGLAERRVLGFRRPGAEAVLDELELEHDNFRVALTWALSADPETALTLCASLMHFWHRRDHVVEAARWFALTSARADEATPSARAAFFLAAAGVALHLNELGRAAELAAKSLELARELGDDAGTARALEALGTIAWARDDPAAEQYLAQALERYRASGGGSGLYSVLHHLAEVLRDRGELAPAKSLFEESLELSRADGNETFAMATTHSLGDLALDSGDIAAAEARYREALTVAVTVGSKGSMAACLGGLAAVRADRGRTEEAARLWGAVEAIEDELGVRLLPRERERYERALGDVQPVATAAGDAYRIALSLD